MVGKPNLPEDADWRPELKGASCEAPGLTALDEERQASMADEGGASGAAVEVHLTALPAAPCAPARRPRWLYAAVAGAALATFGFLLRRRASSPMA